MGGRWRSCAGQGGGWAIARCRVHRIQCHLPYGLPSEIGPGAGGPGAPYRSVLPSVVWRSNESVAIFFFWSTAVPPACSMELVGEIYIYMSIYFINLVDERGRKKDHVSKVFIDYCRTLLTNGCLIPMMMYEYMNM